MVRIPLPAPDTKMTSWSLKDLSLLLLEVRLSSSLYRSRGLNFFLEGPVLVPLPRAALRAFKARVAL